MTRLCNLITIALVIAASNAIADDEITIDSVPPVVIKTVPEAGTSEVDANTTEIRVTFSKAMTDGSWSWSTLSKESFPEVQGKPSYMKGERTCILPVKLQPDKTYAIWINSNKFRNFKDTTGVSAVPYLLVFKTAQCISISVRAASN